jgi:hypothetical protein
MNNYESRVVIEILRGRRFAKQEVYLPERFILDVVALVVLAVRKIKLACCRTVSSSRTYKR